VIRAIVLSQATSSYYYELRQNAICIETASLNYCTSIEFGAVEAP